MVTKNVHLFSYLPAIPPTTQRALKSVTRGTKVQVKENKILYLWEHSVQLDYSIRQQDILNSLSCTPDECSC